jgi:hypothetical protein
MAATLSGCSDPVGPVPGPVPDVPVELLEGAPVFVEHGGLSFTLRTDLWRDFMPPAEPCGSPLMAVLMLCEADSVDIPSDIDLAYMWALNDGEVWSVALEEEPDPSWYPPHVLGRTARGGPKWGPHIFIDVVVAVVTPGNGTFLLAARDQWIVRTE